MAGSAYKDLALGDSVKVTDPIEELIKSFGTGQPMVFQVPSVAHGGCEWNHRPQPIRRSWTQYMPVLWSVSPHGSSAWPVADCHLFLQVGFDVQPEVTWKSSYRELKVRHAPRCDTCTSRAIIGMLTACTLAANKVPRCGDSQHPRSCSCSGDGHAPPSRILMRRVRKCRLDTATSRLLQVEVPSEGDEAADEVAIDGKLLSLRKQSGTLRVVNGRGLRRGDTVICDFDAGAGLLRWLPRLVPHEHAIADGPHWSSQLRLSTE